MVGSATEGVTVTTITTDSNFWTLQGPPTGGPCVIQVSLFSKRSSLHERAGAAIFIGMKFENDKGEQVEVNFQNFERILPGPKLGYTLVKLKNGKEESLLATENEILEATAEE
jgi:hypothetical protein